ncbi:MAG: hypothetical protein KF830_13800 [Planctomycetes bacterium]|nr:hypothetical protein [Planctomycetota bacterium]
MLAASCSRKGTAPPEVFAAATIGPEGGEVAVLGGKQAGLRVTVPAGALTAAIELRVVDAEVALPADLLATSYVPDPAPAFRLEPVDVYLELPAALQLPYLPQRLTGMAPGNVRVRQQRAAGTVDHEPTAVDAVVGRAELSLRTFGRFQVVRGPQAAGLSAYQPPVANPVPLEGGWSFAVEEVAADSPFAGPGAVQWRLEGPGFAEALCFDGLQMTGREAAPHWREVWSAPVTVWQDVALVVPQATTFVAQVHAPVSMPSFGGLLTVFGAQSWDLPRRCGDQWFYDVVTLRLALAWNRHDLGTGQREYRFWFAPGIGLLALGIDGVVHERTSP